MFPKQKPYDGFIQIAAMRSRFPQFRIKRKGNLDIEFTGDLQAKATHPVFTVFVHYRGSLPPVVKILKPELVESPPHFYRSAGEPCLYKPSNYHWSKTRLVATDIIPWIVGWLYFYQVWLKTGKWLGPEAEHDEESKNKIE